MKSTRPATNRETAFLCEQANQIGLDFLNIDLDVALTFMGVAEASQNQETVERNHRNARKAYDAVIRLLPKLTPEPDQRAALKSRLDHLKAQLQAKGQQF